MTTQPLTYVEIDLAYCSRTFGVAPCTASGADQCFNTRNRSHDCEDPANYLATDLTVRFAIDSGFLPSSIDCIPSLISAEMTPAKIDIGESIGQRATLTCRLKNHKHNDVGLDKNLISRSYDPYELGTFWGKFVARNPYTFRRPIRLIQGYLGQSISEMDTYNFVIEKIDGPNTDGEVTIEAVDFMRFLDGDTAQIPAVSGGSLNASITDSATSATLKPAGIGNAEYPASGTAIIGDEIITFTRSGDALTIVRGTNGTSAESHDADETVQLCYVQTAKTEAEIINDMLVNYTDLDSSYIELTDWENEVDNYSGLLYTGIIPKPMAVKAAIDEFIKQSGILLYPDIMEQKIRLSVIRPISESALEINDSNSFAGIKTSSTNKRFSQVWTYFNQKNKADALSDEKNYLTIYAALDGTNPHEVESIKKIYSRWLPPAAVSAADNISSRILSRYRVAPITITRKVPRGQSYKLGQPINVRSRIFEDAFGQESVIPCQVVAIKYLFDGVELTLEEMRFDESLLSTDRIFIFDYDAQNVDLRAIHDSVYSSLVGTPLVRFIVNSGIKIGSSSASGIALKSGSWPGGVVPELINNGYIVGCGGNCGTNGSLNGSAGGRAMLITSAIDITNNLVIGGGGGGGGSSYFSGSPSYFVAGGGGAGYDPGASVASSAYVVGGNWGSTTTGGTAGSSAAGAGGNLGTSGSSATGGTAGGTGGAAGVAVDGDSLVTWTTLGTVNGSRIN